MLLTEEVEFTPQSASLIKGTWNTFRFHPWSF